MRLPFEFLAKILSAVVGPTFTATSIQVLEATGTPKPAAVVASVVLGTIVTAFAVAIQGSWRKIETLRKAIDPRSRFEGIWIQRFRPGDNDPVVFSLAHIHYVDENDDYRLDGNGYDAQGNPISHFESQRLQFGGVSVGYGWSESDCSSSPSERTIVGDAAMNIQEHDGMVGGNGTLFHVTDKRRRTFDLEKVSRSWLARRRMEAYRLDDSLSDFMKNVARQICKESQGSKRP